ncbi:MAG TPA: hypothetical protein VFV07_03845 [Rhizomicrobium sp.]|nr:hypothetical protein [Rhizomicrobium sp.]
MFQAEQTPHILAQPDYAAAVAGLRYVSDEDTPGIRRERHGTGFTYRIAGGIVGEDEYADRDRGRDKRHGDHLQKSLPVGPREGRPNANPAERRPQGHEDKRVNQSPVPQLGGSRVAAS